LRLCFEDKILSATATRSHFSAYPFACISLLNGKAAVPYLSSFLFLLPFLFLSLHQLLLGQEKFLVQNIRFVFGLELAALM